MEGYFRHDATDGYCCCAIAVADHAGGPLNQKRSAMTWTAWKRRRNVTTGITSSLPVVAVLPVDVTSHLTTALVGQRKHLAAAAAVPFVGCQNGDGCYS